MKVYVDIVFAMVFTWPQSSDNYVPNAATSLMFPLNYIAEMISLFTDASISQDFGCRGCVSLVPGVEEERLVHTDALPVN